MADSGPAWLSALLAPVSVDEFLSTYWLKQHLFCRGSSERFSHFLSWPALNRILEHHWRETYRFRLAMQGRDLEPAAYADLGGSIPRIRAKDVTDCLRRGATLSFDAIDELHEPLTSLAESFEAFFHAGTQINVYAVWSAVHGLDLHRDDQEVFILQLEGRKRWLLYGSTIDGVDRSQLETASLPPDGAVLDEIVGPGDLLYIPRGCYHLVVPMNEPTLHLTLGVKSPRQGSTLKPRPSFNLPSSVAAERLPTLSPEPASPVVRTRRDCVVTDNGFTVAAYRQMMSDAVRMDAYLCALQHAITPDSVVVDIGTGTGIFALLACRLGARRVYAIEPGDVIQVAREIAAASGCGDRIEFIQALSTDVTLPERADVIVSDLGGALPWFQQHIASIVDARRRFLAPDGVLIPRRDTAWAAVVELHDVYAERLGPWEKTRFGFDMEAARRIVVNTFMRATVTPDNVLTELRRWAVLDYAVVEERDVRARVSWRVIRAGTGHGLAVGFDRTLTDAICFSNAPDVADALRATVYPTLFFPWPEPIALQPDDVVTVDIEARFVRSDYIWNWKTQVNAGAGDHKADFHQSTFFGVPLSPETLRTKSAGA